MKRILPAIQKSVFFRENKLSMMSSISELGVYGILLSQGNSEEKPLYNEYAGYLLRTKVNGIDEGGVATGYSVLNSVSLQ